MLFPPSPRPAIPPRVVVTGAGIVSPFGLGWAANAERFRSGRPAFRPITVFDASRQRTKIAAEVDLPVLPPLTSLTTRQQNRLERGAQMLLHAAHEAWMQAGWRPTEESLPLVLGTTSGGMTLGQDYYRQAISEPFRDYRQAVRVTHYQPQRQALDLADAFGFHGPVTIIANACASGANAVGHAFELIRSGRARRAMAGGYDALSQLVFAGFASLQALSSTTCRPFDAHRDGLALGEGAAVLCLETLDSARKRNVEIVGEIVGYGTATDVHHLTQPHPQGDAALAAMNAACRDAGVSPEHIGYVNAHGTGTPANDVAEANAISRWAGARAATLPVSSTKAGIGHLLGAAGIVETAVCLMALRGQWLPPQLSMETPDAACTFPLVCAPQDGRIEFALTNSFGFGGANASLVLRRFG